jgi:replicative DNA helicase
VKITTKAPRHEAIGEIAAGLKELARELNIPVIALAQVNREVEKRVNKRPFMGDLKDSGTIEQEADQIFMLYRDEVYNEETKDKGLAEINIEKNRHGSTGRVDLAWRGEYLRFENLMRAVA